MSQFKVFIFLPLNKETHPVIIKQVSHSAAIRVAVDNISFQNMSVCRPSGPPAARTPQVTGKPADSCYPAWRAPWLPPSPGEPMNVDRGSGQGPAEQGRQNSLNNQHTSPISSHPVRTRRFCRVSEDEQQISALYAFTVSWTSRQEVEVRLQPTIIRIIIHFIWRCLSRNLRTPQSAGERV